MVNKNYLLIHGRGGDLGNFKVFSDTHKKSVETSDKGAKVVQESAERARQLREILEHWSVADKINELHIWSHSIGAGLFLGYQDPILQSSRDMFVAYMQALARKPTFDEVRENESGALFTDDLIVSPWLTSKSVIATKFAKGASVKIWGCKAAITNWVYSDTGAGGVDIVDPADTSTTYYWRALNERNQPKPSIAQALADYFGIRVLGASSGSNIQIAKDKVWMATDAYKKKFGKFPPGTLPHRLHPTKGDYNPYDPTPTP